MTLPYIPIDPPLRAPAPPPDLRCDRCGKTTPSTPGPMPRGWQHHKLRGAEKIKAFDGIVLWLCCPPCSKAASADPLLLPEAKPR